jgi:NADH-quinone oxidoreductase subunit J
MLVADFLFYVFAALLTVSAVVVISARNAVHSVLFLILAFFNAAGIFVLMGAEYIAMLLVIVYVGAVAVLFLFVVMMLDVAAISRRTHLKRHLSAGLLVGFLLIAELGLVFHAWQGVEGIENNRLFPVANRDDVGSAQSLGTVLYTDYILPFQLSGLILLVAMVGAILLCLRVRGGVRRQNTHAQVTRRPSDAMDVVSVETGKGVE